MFIIQIIKVMEVIKRKAIPIAVISWFILISIFAVIYG
jgi:hypothetical protein